MKRAVALSAMVLLAGLAGIVALSNAQAPESGNRGAKKPPLAASPRIIGVLETRDHRIELRPHGRYTIRTRSGKIEAKDVTLDSLRARKPQLHSILERALANPNRNNDAGLGPTRFNQRVPTFQPN